MDAFEKAMEIITLCRRYKSNNIIVTNPSNVDHDIIIPIIRKFIKNIKIEINATNTYTTKTYL
jgi:hypothetical protein